MNYINALETALGKRPGIHLLPLQPGDVPDTYANVDDLIEQFDYKPATPVTEGVDRFVAWYKEYFNQ